MHYFILSVGVSIKYKSALNFRFYTELIITEINSTTTLITAIEMNVELVTCST